jgi:hypothetical protein
VKRTAILATSLWDARFRVKNGRLYLEDLATVINKRVPPNERFTRQELGILRKRIGLSTSRGGDSGKTYIIWPGDDEVALIDKFYWSLK